MKHIVRTYHIRVEAMSFVHLILKRLVPAFARIVMQIQGVKKAEVI